MVNILVAFWNTYMIWKAWRAVVLEQIEWTKKRRGLLSPQGILKLHFNNLKWLILIWKTRFHSRVSQDMLRLIKASITTEGNKLFSQALLPTRPKCSMLVLALRLMDQKPPRSWQISNFNYTKCFQMKSITKLWYREPRPAKNEAIKTKSRNNKR